MGLLITVEGGEMTGKTTVVIPSLLKILKDAGVNAIYSREPGGTPEGEIIRAKIFRRLAEDATARELAELFNEARRIHLEQVIYPHIGRDKSTDGVVLLDRYADSTMVYQGLEGGVSINELIALHNEYTDSFFPDLTYILQIPEHNYHNIYRVRELLAKGEAQRDVNNWDTASIKTHLERQKRYLQLPDVFRELGIQRHFEIINASQKPHDVVWHCTESLIPVLLSQGCNLSLSVNSKEGFMHMFNNLNWNELDAKWQAYLRAEEQINKRAKEL